MHSSLGELLPARLARPSAADDEGAWLLLYVCARLAATVIAAALIAWAGFPSPAPPGLVHARHARAS